MNNILGYTYSITTNWSAPKGHYQWTSPVYAKLLKGSCPDIPLNTVNLKPVVQPDVAIELTELFFKSGDKAKCFGVIVARAIWQW